MSDNIKLGLILVTILTGFFLLSTISTNKNSEFGKVIKEYQEKGKGGKLAPEDISKGIKNR